MLFTRRQFAVMAVVLICLAVGFLIVQGNRIPEISTTASTDFGDSAIIARGKYLATAGNCASCHSIEGGEFMAGGLPFDTPFGTLYSTNISPDIESGIGTWSAEDFFNSMRHGIRPDGEHLYPAFPYTAFTKVNDEDVFAIYAYLKSIPPVPEASFENELMFPFNIRALMAVWKALFFEPGSLEGSNDKSDQWNRGAYLVEALAHCSACHSPRNLLGAEKTSLAMSGGEYVDAVNEEIRKHWSAPNLTSAERALALWSDQETFDYLKTARNGFLESFGPMNEVIINSTSQLSDADVAAMVVYLKSLPAITKDSGAHPDDLIMGRGRTIYNLHCGTCHLPTGEGDPQMAPKLNQGSLVVQAENPASMINAILYSPKTPGPPLLPKWRHPMDEFQYLLDDEEVAAVASFVRNSWENSAGIVTAEQVARQR